MEKVEALSENLGFVCLSNPETLPGMDGTQPANKFTIFVGVSFHQTGLL